MKHITKDKTKHFFAYFLRLSFPLLKKVHFRYLVRQNEYITVLCLDIAVRIKFGPHNVVWKEILEKVCTNVAFISQYLRTYFCLLKYLSINFYHGLSAQFSFLLMTLKN